MSIKLKKDVSSLTLSLKLLHMKKSCTMAKIHILPFYLMRPNMKTNTEERKKEKNSVHIEQRMNRVECAEGTMSCLVCYLKAFNERTNEKFHSRLLCCWRIAKAILPWPRHRAYSLSSVWYETPNIKYEKRLHKTYYGRENERKKTVQLRFSRLHTLVFFIIFFSHNGSHNKWCMNCCTMHDVRAYNK